MRSPVSRPVHAGIDVGGTGIQVVLLDEGLRPVRDASVPTPAKAGGQAIIGTAVGVVRELLAAGDYTLAGVGVGAAGVVDSVAGRVLVVSDSFEGWAGYPIRDHLLAAFEVPVAVDNDVNAFLAGEMVAGAGRGSSHALGITLGTGVGGALWLGGALYAGPGGAAGEIGHMPGFGDRPCTCGAAGHLETLASGLSISRLHLERSGALLTALEVAGAAVAGDQPAREIFDEVGRALARAVLVGTALLDIDTVVIGGGVSNAWKLFQPALFEQLRVEPPVRGAAPSIVLAELGALAVATGAAIRSHRPLGV